VAATTSWCSLRGRQRGGRDGDGDGESGAEAAAGERCPGEGCGEKSWRGLHSPGRLGGTGDGDEGEHGRPLGRGDVPRAAAAQVERERGVWRGRAGG